MAGDGQLVLSDRHRGDPRLQGKIKLEFVAEMDQRPALASRYPLVAESRWFADVAGETLAEVAAALPAERVAILQERGQARDLEATVAELLAELRGSPPLA